MVLRDLERRVEKIEQATGINEPCEVCDAIDRCAKRVVELQYQLGIESDKRAPVIKHFRCAWCLRDTVLDVVEYTEEERALVDRIEEGYANGTYCADPSLWDELAAAFDRVDREKYGAHYDRFREIYDACNAEIEEVMTRRAPRNLYLCRVPGCSCNSPKTEAEWLRNVRYRAA